MGDVVHLRDSTAATRLDEIEVEVYASIDRMCLRVGALLHEARSLDPTRFRAWVDESMPFGYDKGSRLVAIHLAYSELPVETQTKLPRPWQALYALRHWAGGRLDQALESGEVGPDTTVAEAKARARQWSSDRRPEPESRSARYTKADDVAGALLGEYAADDLNPYVFEALKRWMSARTPGRT